MANRQRQYFKYNSETFLSNWIYQGKEIIDESDVPEGMVGFVYLITNNVTGRKYIGRKILTSTTRKPPKKGETRRKKVVKSSNWQNYFGSSEEMIQSVLTYGKESFTREIVRFCKSKTEMAYYECKEIFALDALIKEEFINKWITCQINGKNLHYLK